jgi:hypothetical protein
MTDSSPTRKEVWRSWTQNYISTEPPTPLFHTDEKLRVTTKKHGEDGRPVLERRSDMEAELVSAGRRVVEDWQAGDDRYDGVIYIMYTIDNSEIIPRYIGKSAKYGRDGKSLNSNLKNIRTNRSKMARWGDAYDYHIGELSRAVLGHHKMEQVNSNDEPRQKYADWAEALFVDNSRQLSHPVYFWAKAWHSDDTGPFHDFDTKLGGLEYHLITLASELYPDQLLNSEGT